MRNDVVLSFCIPVYNQIELVKRCVSSIIEYEGSDIEVIVSDDCSTENIQEMIEELNDSRIHYHRNECNLGHDLNIIKSFEEANGRYAFLLRSRDYMLLDGINSLIEMINQYPECAYLTGTAVDEEGNVRYAYEKNIIKKGIDTLQANFTLYIHPSGSAYSLEKLELEKLKQFIVQNVDSKYGFIAHSLMRMQLAVEGDFVLVKEPTWVYANVLKNNDVAVNHIPGRISVYDPEYTKKRFKYAIKWASDVIGDDRIEYVFLELYSQYLDSITWSFNYRNKDKDMQFHYSCDEIKFSVSKSRKEFFDFALEEISLASKKGELNKTFVRKMKTITLKNKYLGWIKYFVMRVTKETKFYYAIASIYKKIKYKKL